MTAVPRVILDVVGTIALALLLLGGWFSILGGGFPEAARVLFNFMDVGLAIWLILLIVFTVRSRQARPPAWRLLVVGAVVNLAVVTTVGFVQTGGLDLLLIGYAIQAGIACLIAGAAVITIVHRATRPPK